MAAYMLMVDYPELRARAAQHTHERLLRFVVQVRNIALAAFGGYLRAELLLSVGVFFILLMGFFLIGQSYGLLLALGLAMLDFIPIVGAGTIMVPWAFLALFTHDYAQAIQIMLIWGVIAMFRRVGEPEGRGGSDGTVAHSLPDEHLCGDAPGRRDGDGAGSHSRFDRSEPGEAGSV